MTEEHIRALTVQGVSYTYRVLRQPAPTMEPVVVLGGVLESMYDWPHLEESILSRTSMVTVDMPGLEPASFREARQGSIDLLVAGVEGIVADLGAARVNFYGYSLGSAIAFRYAQRHPERVARLLLGGVPVELTHELVAQVGRAVDRARAGDEDGFADLVADLLLCRDTSHHVHRRALTLAWLRRSLRNVIQTRRAIDLLEAALTCHTTLTGGLTGVPTVVFSGGHDHLHAPEKQRDLAATIDGSQFVTFPDCDHMLPLERPEAVSSLVDSFLLNQRESQSVTPVS
ncbi:alpha/beta hydrolase [Streptomyces sp. CdTB01]|uniref:alpha/beta fold hydrolase n=1 Tax=Streptomyces sp. CdTB01 TaxID=1725411 RepID=UPI00073AD13D|nr:alpha/beta hydrolase [Streptomyces sp. CdTB01]ALV31276.1 hypothetical protein AS200_03805 [Streptomyces sp. CdTB01]